MKSVGRGRRKRNMRGGKKGKRSFGMVILQPKSALWTSTRQMSISTNKSPLSTVRRVLAHRNPTLSALVSDPPLLHRRSHPFPQHLHRYLHRLHKRRIQHSLPLLFHLALSRHRRSSHHQLCFLRFITRVSTLHNHSGSSPLQLACILHACQVHRHKQAWCGVLTKLKGSRSNPRSRGKRSQGSLEGGSTLRRTGSTCILTQYRLVFNFPTTLQSRSGSWMDTW